ncbi:hypothetical protein [Actinocorallia longicatena]|uniref:Secreted protein n=1 Tax=Actinocorallia longicatena TaxID=111803 RepID=A0ABP6QGY8_9ACTN
MKHPGAIVLAIILTLGGSFVLTTDRPSLAAPLGYCAGAQRAPASEARRVRVAAVAEARGLPGRCW